VCLLHGENCVSWLGVSKKTDKPIKPRKSEKKKKKNQINQLKITKKF